MKTLRRSCGAWVGAFFVPVLALGDVGHLVISTPVPVWVRAPEVLGDFPGAIGGVGTNDRPDPATYEYGGVVYTAEAGRSRNVPYDGTLIEGQTTNEVTAASDFVQAGNTLPSGWVSSGSITLTHNVAAAPYGHFEALTKTLAVYKYIADPSSGFGIVWTSSVWCRSPTSTPYPCSVGLELDSAGAADCRCSAYSSAGPVACIAYARTVNECWAIVEAVADTPIRIAATRSHASSAGRLLLTPDDVRTNAATRTMWFSAPQVEQRSTMSSFVPVTTTPVTRRAERAYYTSEGCPSHATGKWSVVARVKPYGGAAWTESNRTIWSAGTKGAVNTVRQVATTAGNLVTTYINNVSGGQTSTETVAHGMPAVPVLPVGNGRQIATQNVLQDLEQFIDGVKQAETQVDGGVRTWTASPPTIYFGSNSTVNDEVLNGYLADWYCQPTEL